MGYGLSYIARDRSLAIAEDRALADRAEGAVLSADIAGFTPLTALLSTHLGPQRGAEELTHILNLVYAALIIEVERAGGSVIGFSGDAITCWFEGDRGLVASACGLALQAAMQPFAAMALPAGLTVNLRLKVAIASGAVRRFLVGDPGIQYLDVLAGEALDRLAAVEAQVGPGEVALEIAAARALADQLVFAAPRSANRDGIAVVEAVNNRAGLLAEGRRPRPALTDEQVQPWILPAVARFHERDHALFTELRPTVALFMGFDGLDYSRDQGQQVLDALIRHVQRVLARYEGTLLQVTVGDKGSYLYAAFGAPIIHEDDAERAVYAASELHGLPVADFALSGVRIGLCQGVMRIGVYGSDIRRTYGVLGDAANVAARLMQQCRPGQVLASSELPTLAPRFAWKAVGALNLKGRAAPLEAVVLEAAPAGGSAPDHAPLPMVGRAAELADMLAACADAAQGRGRVIAITGEAGIGKSRLLADLLAVLERGWVVAQGECQSYGVNSPYLVWHAIWRGLFGLDAHMDGAEQIRQLEDLLTPINPDFRERIPLLGPVLNLSIPDNDLTRGLPANLQRESREALLLDYLRAQTSGRDAGRGIALILEDCHWIDELSHTLLLTLSRIVADLPIVIVATYRPAEPGYGDDQPALGLANAREYRLTALDPDDVGRFLHVKVAQATRLAAPIPAAVVDHVRERTSGNPFYMGELVQYLVALNLDPSDPAVWDSASLPDSLQRLILSRIDQLTTQQQRTIKLSSVLGRLVRARWLYGAYPNLGPDREVLQALDALSQRDLMQPASDQDDVAYLFKHVITQDVTYHSLTHATRVALHEQFGQYLERLAAGEAWAVDLLAYHYGLTENLDKQRLYLRRAGDAARTVYANDAAARYYRRLLPLLDDPDERSAALLLLGEVLDMMGEWQAALQVYEEARELAAGAGQPLLAARCQRLIGMTYRKQGDYPAALSQLTAVQAECEQLHNATELMEVLLEISRLFIQQGHYSQAADILLPQLALARQVDDYRVQSVGFDMMAMINYYQGHLTVAIDFLEQGLRLSRELGDVVQAGLFLGHLGVIKATMGEYDLAQEYCLESLQMHERIGHKYGIVKVLSNLVRIALQRQDYALAIKMAGTALQLSQESGNLRSVISHTIQIGRIYMIMGEYAESREHNESSLVLARSLGDQMILTHALTNLVSLEFEEGRYGQALDWIKECLAGAAAIGYQLMIGYVLVKSAAVAGRVAGGAADPSSGFQSAIKLLGAGTAVLAERKIALEAYEQGLADELVAAARERLAEDEYAAAWEAGRQLAADLKPEDAIALAERAILG